jgi:hypothetical protein
MLDLEERMAVVVIARNWILRMSVRAELRERGVDALGMDSPDDVGRALASGQVPAAVVLEGTADLASDPGILNLIPTVPTLLIASRTEKIPLLPEMKKGSAPYAGAVLYRPVLVGDVASRLLHLLRKGHAA